MSSFPRIIKILVIHYRCNSKEISQLLSNLSQEYMHPEYVCDFTVFSDPFSALIFCQHSFVDFIICHRNMPQIYSSHFLYIVKKVGCCTPVVELVNSDSIRNEKEARDEGFFGLIMLDYKASDIERIINKYLDFEKAISPENIESMANVIQNALTQTQRSFSDSTTTTTSSQQTVFPGNGYRHANTFYGASTSTSFCSSASVDDSSLLKPNMKNLIQKYGQSTSDNNSNFNDYNPSFESSALQFDRSRFKPSVHSKSEVPKNTIFNSAKPKLVTQQSSDSNINMPTQSNIRSKNSPKSKNEIEQPHSLSVNSSKRKRKVTELPIEANSFVPSYSPDLPENSYQYLDPRVNDFHNPFDESIDLTHSDEIFDFFSEYLHSENGNEGYT